VLLLDEPASGLDETETRQLGVLLRRLAAEGLAVLLVEHDMSLVMDICDSVSVLDLGRVIASGTPAEVRTHPLVIEAYLGAA
jgi:branched-chain amino acid transport system ATP-binding protein